MNYSKISNFGKTKWSALIAFTWGFSEGLLFFVVPDVYLSYIALFTFTGGLTAVSFALLGSLASAGVIYLLLPTLGTSYHSILTSIPGISETMISKVTTGLQTNGVIEIVRGPFSGIPYKIYSVEAALQHKPFLEYIFWSVPARLERMLPVTIVALVLGYFFRESIKKHTKLWLLAFCIIWTLIYISYYRNLS